MKIVKPSLFMLLAIALAAGAMQAPAGASPLKDVKQLRHLYYDANGWHEALPDGTLQAFALKPGQTFVMTLLSVRFYADTPNTGPYRLFLKAPNGTKLWIESMDNVQYPTTGTIVYGGVKVDTLDPGISMSVLPTLEVRQLPQPPANPNSGPVISGTFYDFFLGYTVP